MADSKMATNTNPDLPTRLKTAAILIAIFLIIFNFAIYSSLGAKFFSGFVFAIIAIASFEFCKLPTDQSLTHLLVRLALTLLPAAASFFIGVLPANINFPQTALAIYFSSVIVVAALGISLYAMRAQVESQLTEIVLAIGRDSLGFLLLGVGGAATVLIAWLAPVQALLLVTIVAVADTSAYFAGRSFGKAKVAPIVSPKKTVVGTLVGILFAGLVGMILLSVISQSCFTSWGASLLYATAIGICSQAGDYSKSIIKRHYNIKDFGRILPGHGGVLDRLDGILGAAPLSLVLVMFVCNR